MTEIQSGELLEFFKALSDANRLKIVGILAKQSRNVEQIAEDLGVSVSTVSHHLSYLSRVGLVEARAQGHYYIYSLKTETLRAMAQHLLTQDNLPKLSEEVEGDSFERKVMANFVDAEGRITAFPAQEKKFLVLLRYVLKAFEPGKHYSEKQVNETLLRFHSDTALMRRSLVDFAMMARQGGGGEYWRVDE